MEEYDDDEPTNFPRLIFFCILAVIFLYIAKDWGSWIVPKNWTILIEGCLIYAAGMLPYWVSRYRMPQFQADGCHGSFQHNESPLPVPDYFLIRDPKFPNDKTKFQKVKFNWLVYGLGASLLPIPTKGRDCVCIVPEVQVDTKGKNHFTSTQVFLTPLDKLPLPVAHFLINYKANYNLKRIYIGSKKRSYDPKQFDDADKDLKIELLQAQVNQRDKMLSGDFGIFEKVKNLSSKLNPKASVMESIFRRSPQADQNVQQS